MEVNRSAQIWCTLVMLNDRYSIGAAVMAQSLRIVGTEHPIWCMIAGDVSSDCEEFLKTKFDNVIRAPLITQPCVHMRTQKQQRIYSSWIHASFTKWNILNPELFPVDKIILVDADMIFLKNCDELFNTPAPALTFSSPWAAPYMTKYGGYNPYYTGRELQHGEIVPPTMIRQGFNGGILGLACMVLVKPSAIAYNNMLKILRRDGELAEYGYSKCISGFDEQLIAETLLSVGDPIYNIHQKYNWIVGKYNWLLDGEIPWSQQYYNGKPWDGVFMVEDRVKIENSEWDDVRDWWLIADMILLTDPAATRWFYPGHQTQTSGEHTLRRSRESPPKSVITISKKSSPSRNFNESWRSKSNDK